MSVKVTFCQDFAGTVLFVQILIYATSVSVVLCINTSWNATRSRFLQILIARHSSDHSICFWNRWCIIQLVMVRIASALSVGRSHSCCDTVQIVEFVPVVDVTHVIGSCAYCRCMRGGARPRIARYCIVLI